MSALRWAARGGLQIGLGRGGRRMGGFAELGLSSDVVGAVEALGFAEPTSIQRKAIPLLTAGRPAVALASETGGGKTLAYLLPMVEMLKRHESAHGLEIRRPGRPRALVLTPSPELSRQVASQLKELAHAGIGIASCALSQEQRLKSHAIRLAGCVDIVVSTPRLLLRHCELGHVALADVRLVAVDEAEVLLARGPCADLDAVLHAAGITQHSAEAVAGVPDGRQVIFASATFTAELRAQLGARFPRAQTVESGGLHRISPTAKVRWVRIDTRDRYRAVVELLKRRGAAGAAARASGQTIVFCNTVQAARACEHAINEAGIRAVSCHGKLPPQRRRAEVDDFVGSGTHAARLEPAGHRAGSPLGAESERAKRSGEAAVVQGGEEQGDRWPGEMPPVLVATDAASRGLHFERVSHVVMADFPKDMADFVHRAGRTARQGRPGEVSVLVGARDAEIAEALRARVEQGQQIEPVSAARPGSRERDASPPANRLERLAALAERRREPHKVSNLLTALGARSAAAPSAASRQSAAAKRGARVGDGASSRGKANSGKVWFYTPGRGRSAMRAPKGAGLGQGSRGSKAGGARVAGGSRPATTRPPRFASARPISNAKKR